MLFSTIENNMLKIKNLESQIKDVFKTLTDKYFTRQYLYG
jgi:hypothetical protein